MREFCIAKLNGTDDGLEVVGYNDTPEGAVRYAKKRTTEEGVDHYVLQLTTTVKAVQVITTNVISHAKTEPTDAPKPKRAYRRKSRANQPWTDDEMTLLRRMVSVGKPAKDIAKRLGRTPTSIYQRVHMVNHAGQ